MWNDYRGQLEVVPGGRSYISKSTRYQGSPKNHGCRQAEVTMVRAPAKTSPYYVWYAQPAFHISPSYHSEKLF